MSSLEKKNSGASLLFLIFCAAFFLLSNFVLGPALPERVATHFDGAGRADGWMTRSQYVTFISLFGLFLAAIGIGLCFSMRFFPPSMLNVPNAAYWRSKEHYAEACNILLRWSFWFGGTSLIWVAILNYLTVQANRITPPHLPTSHVLIFSGAYLAALGILVVVLYRGFVRKVTAAAA